MKKKDNMKCIALPLQPVHQTGVVKHMTTFRNKDFCCGIKEITTNNAVYVHDQLCGMDRGFL